MTSGKIHGPPLRTGSVDYLRTGPRTTPTDPSTDHPPNKIKNKNKDFTYCLSNRSLVSAKFRALRWSTLGKCDNPGFSLEHKLCHCRSLHLCHFRCCRFAWKTGKPKKFVISFPSPFCVYIWNSAWQIVKTGTSSRSRGRIGRTKWRRKCIFRGFPEISRSFIYTYSHSNEKNGNVECQWYKLRPRLNSGLLHFPSVTLEISTQVIYCCRQELKK